MHSFIIYKVIPAGFEPTTHSLEGCCSIQLSYGTITYKPTKGFCVAKINLLFLLSKKSGILLYFSCL